MKTNIEKVLFLNSILAECRVNSSELDDVEGKPTRGKVSIISVSILGNRTIIVREGKDVEDACWRLLDAFWEAIDMSDDTNIEEIRGLVSTLRKYRAAVVKLKAGSHKNNADWAREALHKFEDECECIESNLDAFVSSLTCLSPYQREQS